MSELEQLYQAAILEHHKQPRNSGRLAEPTHVAEGHNPLCGDRLTITARVVEGRVLAVCCDATGCAICRASGSMLTLAVAGRSVAEVSTLIDGFLAMLAGSGAPAKGAGEPDLAPLAALVHVRHFPARLRCATLSWETLRRALASA